VITAASSAKVRISSEVMNRSGRRAPGDACRPRGPAEPLLPAWQLFRRGQRRIATPGI